MNSLDVSHVPPPDPEKFWCFSRGHTVLIGRSPAGGAILELTLLKTRADGAKFLMCVGGRNLTDWLELDRPCVVLRMPNNEPAVTFTLRRVEHKAAIPLAFLQVTAHSKLRTEPRPN